MTQYKEKLDQLVKELSLKYPEISQDQLIKLARQKLYEKIPKHIRESIEKTNSSIGKGINLW